MSYNNWHVLKFPAIAEEDETYEIDTPYGKKKFRRSIGEALHPEREPLEVLGKLREILGEYNFAGQYQQAPAPLGGGMVKTEWLSPKFSCLRRLKWSSKVGIRQTSPPN